MSEHIVITGGAGYIGSYLTGALLDEGYFVTVVMICSTAARRF